MKETFSGTDNPIGRHSIRFTRLRCNTRISAPIGVGKLECSDREISIFIVELYGLQTQE